MVDEKDIGRDVARRRAVRDDDGNLRAEICRAGRQGARRRRRQRAARLVGELHEADAGAVSRRSTRNCGRALIALMGADFDFTALTQVDDTVREEILEELAARNRRRGRARPRLRRRRRDPGRPRRKRIRPRSSTNCRRSSASRSSAASTIRNSPPAGGCRTSSSRSGRIGPWARPSTTCARRPIFPIDSGKSTSSTRTAG